MFGLTGLSVRPLRAREVPAALELASLDPVSTTLTADRIVDIADSSWLGDEVLGLHRGGDLVAFCALGANLALVAAPGYVEQAISTMGRRLARMPRRSSAIVGRADEVPALWELLRPAWGPAREERLHQPLLEAAPGDPAPPAGEPGASAEPIGEGLSPLRRAERAEWERIVPAAVDMFRTEVGADPLAGIGAQTYPRRVAQLAAEGRTYVVDDGQRIVFKADVGARFGGVAQIHGVWTAPDLRGHGIASRAMSVLPALVRRDHAPRVTLYVNDFNAPARAAYRRAGWVQVGELASILF